MAGKITSNEIHSSVMNIINTNSNQIGNLSNNLLANTYWVTDPKYGADKTGTNDSTTAIQNSINDCFSAGGGIVFVPAGSYKLTAPIVMKNKVRFLGAGMRTTVLTQTGTGAVINFDASYTSYFYGCEISDMYLSGNTSDNATGDGIYACTQYGLDNCTFKNLLVYTYGRSAFRFEMNSNSSFSGWNQYLNFDNIMIGTGTTIVDAQDYSFYAIGGFSTIRFKNVRTYNIKKGFYFGSYNHPSGMIYPETLTFDTCNVQNINPNLTGNNSVNSVNHGITFKDVYGAVLLNCYVEGISTGDSTNASSGVYVDGLSKNIFVYGGLWSAFCVGVNFNNGTTGKVDGVIFNWNGTVPSTTPTCITMGSLFAVYTLELGSNSLMGTTMTYLNDPSARSVGFQDQVATLRVRTLSSLTLGTINGTYSYPLFVGTLHFWRDSGARFRVKDGTPSSETDGNIVEVKSQSSASVAVANNGTINTSGLSLSRVSPIAAVTGIILQAGVFPGQEIIVVNEAASANSATFAATGSNVADGSSDVINGGTARKFVWDAGTSLWYRIQ